MKKRQENEIYLEEIEKSIRDNIDSTQSLINDSEMQSFMREERPLSMENGNMLKDSQNDPIMKKPSGSEISIINEYPLKINSTFIKNSHYDKSKLNFHQSSGDQENVGTLKYETAHYNSCDTKPQELISTDNDLVLTSARRINSIMKNKAFQDDIQHEENKEMIRAMSHISFTNQTEMFDNYDSGNSAIYENCIDKVKTEITLGDEEFDELGIEMRNSFLNLKTVNNKSSNDSKSKINDKSNDFNNINPLCNISSTEVDNTAEFENGNYYSFQNKNGPKSRDLHKLTYIKDIKAVNRNTCFNSKTEGNKSSRNLKNKENDLDTKTIAKNSQNSPDRGSWISVLENSIDKNMTDQNHSELYKAESQTVANDNKDLSVYNDYTSTVTYVSKYKPIYSK